MADDKISVASSTGLFSKDDAASETKTGGDATSLSASVAPSTSNVEESAELIPRTKPAKDDDTTSYLSLATVRAPDADTVSQLDADTVSLSSEANKRYTKVGVSRTPSRTSRASKGSRLTWSPNVAKTGKRGAASSAPDLTTIDDAETASLTSCETLMESEDFDPGIMNLIVTLKSVRVAGGKLCDRYCKLIFRDKPQKSRLLTSEQVFRYNQTFKWPMARGIDMNDTLTVRTYIKSFTASVYGMLNISLEALANVPEGHLELTESFADSNHALLNAVVELELTYYRPDSSEFDLDADRKSENGSVKNDRSLRGLARRMKKEVQSLSRNEFNFEPFSEADLKEHIAFASKNQELRYLAHFDPTIHRPEDFQLQLTIVEARNLTGVNINPYVEAVIGEEEKRTEVQFGTTSPAFNEYFCFDFKLPRCEVLDQILQLRVYSKGMGMLAKLLRGKLLGEFRMDLRTVWDASEHMIFNKWALLVDPRDASSGSRGYVKIQAHLVARGEETKPHAPQQADPNKPVESIEEIEANLLEPSMANNPVMQKRQIAEISVKIYSAEDLPRMSTDLVSSLHKTILRSDKPMLDPFVSVTYGGHTAETHTKKSTYTPVWNEELTFTDMFPPLCNRVRISIMDATSVGKNEVIATHYIDLAQLMNASQTGFLPTFGPNWVNLYGCPRQYEYEHFLGADEELNKGLGEGVAYRGRLLVAVKAKLVGDAHQIGVKVGSCPAIGDSALGPKEDMTLFGAIYEANVIDAEIGNKKTPLRFELSCAMFGNRIDITSPNDASTDRSYTESMMPQTNDQQYYYLPIENRKPCMHVNVRFEDTRARMLVANAHSRIAEFLEVSIEESLSNLKDMPLDDLIENLKSTACKFVRLVEAVTRNFDDLKGIGVRTLLDKERHRILTVTLEKLKVKAKQIQQSAFAQNDRDSVHHRLKELKSIIPIIHELVCEPQHCLPDVFLWMLAGDQRIAYARVPARDILYAERYEQRGVRCGKVCTLLMRKPGRKGTGKSGWAIQAKMKVYFWLGLVRNIDKLVDGMPVSYTLLQDTCGLPKEIVYEHKSVFQLRAYLYLARNLIGSDETGLSDPFARIILCDKVVTSRVVSETLNPIWDQTLVLDRLTFFSSAAWIKENQTVVVVEIFDHDDDGSSEFLGRTLATPTPIVHSDVHYNTPTLKWHCVHRNQKRAGKLLAAFELIELQVNDGVASFPRCYPEGMIELLTAGADDKRSLSENASAADFDPNVVPIPKQIRPVLAKYRLQLLFWGIRGMKKKVQFRAISKPRVELEWSRYTVKSTTISSLARCPNFPESVTYIDLELPENPMFWSPITLRCFESRPFGRQVFIGSHIISNLIKYIEHSNDQQEKPAEEEKKTILSAINPMNKLNRFGHFLESNAMKIGDIYSRKTVNKSSEDTLETVTEETSMSVAGLVQAPVDKISAVAVDTQSMVTTFKSESASLEPALASAKRSSVSVQNLVAIGAGNEPGSTTSLLRSQQSLPDINLQQSEASPAQLGAATSASAANQGAAGSSTALTVDNVQSLYGTSQPAHATNEGGMADETTPLTVVPYRKPGKALPDEALQFAHADSYKPDKKDIEELDWWTRYYASLEARQEDSDDQRGKKGDDFLSGEGEEGDDDDEDGDGVHDNYSVVDADKLLDGIEVDVQTLDDEPVLEAPDNETRRKKKRKKQPKKSKTISHREAFRRRLKAQKAASQYRSELDAECEDAVDGSQDIKNWLQKFVVYPFPLENVPDFNNFTTFLQSYSFLFGKVSDEDGDEDEQECVGIMKGNLRISRISDEEYGRSLPMNELSIAKRLPPNGCISVLVRVYVVRAIDLAPSDSNGKSDPYLIVKLGDNEENVRNDCENYFPCQLNPIFGRCFEFHATFPQDSELTIIVMDKDVLSGDDEIGQTKIDLENRLLSRHYANCGLPSAYETNGYNRWRDAQLPTQILARSCIDNDLPAPVYDPANYRVLIGESAFYGPNYIEDEYGKVKLSNEPLALAALRQLHTLSGIKLVQEHVETRPLYTEERPGIEQGRIELWVDMFPKDSGVPPAAVDISPREPKKYQLRVTIWNTDEVILNDTSALTGEQSSDIYVKGWLNGADIDMQSTDIHYRSMTGEGYFNWRFLFNFAYLPAEDRIVVKKKDSPLSLDETEYKKPPVLFLQLWDADLIGSDNFLGTLELRLTKYPRPSKMAKSCGLHQYAKSIPQMNAIKQTRCKGWWPFVNKTEETNEDVVTGKLEAEFHLVTAEEAENSPVGLGREEPEPLTPPNRPDVSFTNFLNPLKIIKHLLYRFRWLILKLSILLMVTLFILLLFYTLPGALTQKLVL